MACSFQSTTASGDQRFDCAQTNMQRGAVSCICTGLQTSSLEWILRPRAQPPARPLAATMQPAPTSSRQPGLVNINYPSSNRNSSSFCCSAFWGQMLAQELAPSIFAEASHKTSADYSLTSKAVAKWVSQNEPLSLYRSVYLYRGYVLVNSRTKKSLKPKPQTHGLFVSRPSARA